MKLLFNSAVLLGLFLVTCLHDNAQAECTPSVLSKPAWVKQLSAKGRRFNYYIGQASGPSFSQAFQSSLHQALTTIKSEEQVEIESVLENIETLKAHGDQIEETQNAVSYIKSKANGIIRGAKIEDSFVEITCDPSKRVTVFLLVKTKKKRIDRTVPHPITKGSTLWRSTLVPGWGQIHSGRTSSGYWLMGATLSTLASSIVFNTLAQSNFKQAAQSSIQSDRDFYDQQGNLFTYLTWGFAAASAGLYLYNVFDAGMAEPEKQYYAGISPLVDGGIIWGQLSW